MPLVRLDVRCVRDWNSFHDLFAESFGFPKYYGRNMDAWIDCMDALEDPNTGMLVHGSASDPVVLQLDNINSMPAPIYSALVECAAFVNWRRLEVGQQAMLVLAYQKSRS